MVRLEPLLLTLVASLLPVATSASAVERPIVTLTSVASDDGPFAVLVLVCTLRAAGVPAQTDAYCRVDDVPAEPRWSPAPVAVDVWYGSGFPPFWACAGGSATYRDLTVVHAEEQCYWT